MMIEISPDTTMACTMTLPRVIVYTIDTKRGDTSRSKYVSRLLQKALELEKSKETEK
jgi:hypothetical protein